MKVTKEDVKAKFIKFNNGKSTPGIVFDAVCETIAFYAPEQPEPEKVSGKKSDTKVDPGV